ncbi:MAG: hypothetical protein JW748_14170 [Anaerolineales bacterium]|nr:hypothetical protein [Anaerolineales bacterium]
MRSWWIGIGVAVAAGALGVGAAYGGSELIKTYRPELVQGVRSVRGADARDGVFWTRGSDAGPRDPADPGGIRERLKDRFDKMRDRRPGRFGGTDGERISLDAAAEKAEAYAADLGSEFRVAEVMEFERNFYAVIVEKDGGRGAVEVLIDPYRGNVTPEPGPNMMWNGKYGGRMHRTGQTGENALTIEEARAAAQEHLDRVNPGATVHEGGFSFYGYYTFDYSVDGETAGMLSVHGSTGDVWLHTWHGAFIAEKEMEL